MSIRWDTRNKRWRWEFDRYVQGARKRLSRLLPRGWSQAQADAFDRAECARLYAIATGVQQDDALIDEAVALYLQDKVHLKSIKSAAEHLAAISGAYHGKRLSELSDVAKDVVRKRAGARGKALSDATVRNRLAVLKAACRWAWKKHGICAQDPTTRMMLPAVRNERHVYATREQMLRLARAADRPAVRIAIRVAFYTGMRLGELLRLHVHDGVLVLADTKNGDRRAVPVHPRIRCCLRHLPLLGPKVTLQAGFRRARALAGLGDIHFHDLRHSAASEMVNAGVDLYTVGVVLGHRDPRSTQRYAHLTAGTLSDAVEKIGRKSPHNAQKKQSRAKAA